MAGERKKLEKKKKNTTFWSMSPRPHKKVKPLRHTPRPEELEPMDSAVDLYWKMIKGQQVPRYEEMMEGKWCRYFQAYATLTRPVEMSTWNGHRADPEFTYRQVEAGTRVRIIMASRFGDVGITDALDSPRGYGARVPVLHLDRDEPWPKTFFEDIQVFEYKEE